VALPVYNTGWYGGYPGAWTAAGLANSSLYANPGYGATAGMIGMAPQPIPYDYGGNVVAQPDAMYVNGDPAGTPQQYAEQAGQLAASGGAEPAPNAQWLPIGVFAMVEPGQSNANDVFQLAVNPQGTLRGNYHNLRDNSVVPLAGAVDPKTQRAAWTIGGDKTPVYEAGIANLMRDETSMIVNTGEGPPRQFNLVRLPDPSQANGGEPPPAS
jgi:hypothetical protein